MSADNAVEQALVELLAPAPTANVPPVPPSEGPTIRALGSSLIAAALPELRRFAFELLERLADPGARHRVSTQLECEAALAELRRRCNADPAAVRSVMPRCGPAAIGLVLADIGDEQLREHAEWLAEGFLPLNPNDNVAEDEWRATVEELERRKKYQPSPTGE